MNGYRTLPYRFSKAVVGPLVYFRNQPIPVDRTPPRDTCDGNRWASCTEHHLACDCREAELNEQINELRSEYRLLADALRTAITDHPTFVETHAGVRRRDLECRCDGCVVARRIATNHTLSFFDSIVTI